MRVLASILVCLAVPAAVQAGEVQAAVAANFAGPFTKIGEAFTAATDHALKVSTGSTGKFYTQIVAGAPFDVLLAADDTTPTRLVTDNHAVAGTAFTYAIGRLVLWSAQAGFVDNQGAVLASDKVRHVAIANPKLAPYGAAAMEFLKARGLAQSLTPKLVTGESIAQAYQFAATGNAELGFVALSQVAVPGRPPVGSYWPVPQHLYGEIRQHAVLLKTGEKNPAAKALLDFLKGDAARQIIRDHGYGL